GQPADQGGIRANDVVVSVDGASVEGPRDLQRIISSTPVGKIVKISLMREGKEQEVAVTVGAYQAAPTRAPRRPGPALRPVSRSRRRPAAPFLLGLSLAAALAWVPTAPAAAAQVESLLPSDRLTVPDPGQATGRRPPLRAPDRAADAAGCDEVRLLNELDGWSVNPRIAIRFSGPVALDTVTRATAFIVPLW